MSLKSCPRELLTFLIGDAQPLGKLEKDLREGPGTGNREAAQAVGARLAERAVAAGVKEIVFDRSGYKYHGRVKALADAAREGGLSF